MLNWKCDRLKAKVKVSEQREKSEIEAFQEMLKYPNVILLD